MSKTTGHIIFWITVYLLWSYMKSAGTFYRPIFIINLLNLAIYMSAYYLLRHFQLPSLFYKKKYFLFVISLCISTFTFYAIWRIAGVLWIEKVYASDRESSFMTMVGYLTQSIQFYSPGLLLLAWDFYDSRQKDKIRIEQLEKEKIATELKFLKAQINPHFLFNTLNNLYSFVLLKSPKAPDMIVRLSEMLEYVLYKSQQQSVALKEELKSIQNFIELEKLRYGDRLDVTYETSGDLSMSVSPLLLLSIVENAFKHGASGDAENPKIKIKVKAEGVWINFHAWNTKSKLKGEINDNYKEGIGLANIKKQLNLLYPDQHELTISDSDYEFSISLQLKSKE